MDIPYINTILYTTVTLHAYQMDNNIYLNLKKNLIDMVHRKNFGDYGYIVEVFEILSYNNNRIDAENTMASAMYDVKFSCRLCKPLKNTTLICVVDRINEALMRLKNGPLSVIITNDRLNENVFFKDSRRNLRYKKDNVSSLVAVGDFFKVNILQLSFSAGSDSIVAIGFLKDIASEDEIKEYYDQIYNNETHNFVDYDSYIKDTKAKLEKQEDDELQEETSENTDEDDQNID